MKYFHTQEPVTTTGRQARFVRKMMGLNRVEFGRLFGVSGTPITNLESSDEPSTGPLAILVRMLADHEGIWLPSDQELSEIQDNTRRGFDMPEYLRRSNERS